MSNARNAVNSLRGKECIITFHSLGDLDACASSLAFASFLGKKAIVAPPDRVNSETRRILGRKITGLAKFSAVRKKKPNVPIVLLDANDSTLLPHLKGEKIRLIIDHHAKTSGSARAKCEWIDPGSSSTCELVAQLIPMPTQTEASLLILGILSDSARLAYARPGTFIAIGKLLKVAGKEYEQFLSLLDRPSPVAGRAAVLEGLRNATWQARGKLVACSAQVASHESHIAQALVSCGADFAIVGAEGRGVRISSRMRQAHCSRVDLPALMENVGKFIGGHGGGHPCAAGASGKRKGYLDEALALGVREFFLRANAL